MATPEIPSTHIPGKTGEILELARYEVRAEALEQCLAAIREFVAHVRASEPGALRYEVWQEAERPTRFVHIFVWRDEEANRIHGESAAVKKFAGILYPNCLAPVEFVEYRLVDANAAFRKVEAPRPVPPIGAGAVANVSVVPRG